MRTDAYIGGEWVGSSRRFAVDDPATGDVIAEVTDATVEDAVRACDAADEAQRDWAGRSPRERAEVLRACHELMHRDADRIADLIVAESGKPRSDAVGEVSYAAEFFRWNAEAVPRLHGTIGRNPAGTANIVVQHPPVGVVLLVTPWNFPAAMITRKLAPALGAGNGVVIKPPAETPLTALALADLCTEAGVPAGLLNVVTTSEAADVVEAAVRHAAVRMLSFTGSTATGQILLRLAAERVLNVAMELGGNAPFLVFEDADLDAAVEGAIAAKMRHSAQTCTAANRFLVRNEVRAEFASRLATAMSALEVGPGDRDGVEVGPLINSDAVDRIASWVDAAVDGGARVVTGGSRVEGAGNFYAPTVLDDVSPTMQVACDELFGPVAPVLGFDDDELMIAEANNTDAGLMAYVYTGDLARGLRVSERIRSGMIGLNRGIVSDPAAPFGGMKSSGLGREGGLESLLEFTETRYVAVDW